MRKAPFRFKLANPGLSWPTQASLDRTLEQLEKEMAQLEEKLARQHQPALLTQLRSIPGIGQKDALAHHRALLRLGIS